MRKITICFISILFYVFSCTCAFSGIISDWINKIINTNNYNNGQNYTQNKNELIEDDFEYMQDQMDIENEEENFTQEGKQKNIHESMPVNYNESLKQDAPSAENDINTQKNNPTKPTKLSLANTLLDVTILLTAEGIRKPYILGMTNLPNGTKLFANIWRDDPPYGWRNFVTVKNGNFRIGPLHKRSPYEGGMAYHNWWPFRPGFYNVEIGLTPVGQPKQVLATLGENGCNLSGPLVNEVADIHGIHYKTTLVFGAEASSKHNKTGSTVGNIYRYEDTDGTLHFTDSPGENTKYKAVIPDTTRDSALNSKNKAHKANVPDSIQKTDANTNFSDCLLTQIRKDRKGLYSSSDGGASASRIMLICEKELTAYVNNCELTVGKNEGDCFVAAGLTAQSALILLKRQQFPLAA